LSKCSRASLFSASAETKIASSPTRDPRDPMFNPALNAARFAPLVDTSTKERAMNRLIAYAISAALLVAAAGFMIANAQQSSAPAFIAGDHPVTAEQVREKLQSDGWSNVVISRNGRYIEVTGSVNGQAGKMAVDSETGRLRGEANDDDD
jgi:hypothetical protein